MTKQDAMDEMGCDTLSQLARALEVTPGAVSQWSDPLPEYAERRVLAKLYKRVKPRKKARK